MDQIKSKQWITNTLLIVGVMIVILLMVFKKDPKPIYPITPVKTIEKHIEGKETEINHYFTKIGDEKKIIAAINGQINTLRLELEHVKGLKDTVMIVRIQDTLINTLTAENKSLRFVINTQDSVIVAQRYIINSKDTIIAVGKQQLKKVKRQRNWSLVANGILTGALILKK